MRGDDREDTRLFSYISSEDRVPPDHPLRPTRKMVDMALEELSSLFEEMYSRVGRPSIAPEKLLRALLLQVLYHQGQFPLPAFLSEDSQGRSCVLTSDMV